MKHANPIAVDEPPDGDAERELQRIIGTPRPGGRSRPTRRALGVAVGVAGFLALGGLIAALLIATRGGGSAPVATDVAPPSPTFSILTRPQTPEEARMVLPPLAAQEPQPGSIRIADADSGGRYVLYRTRSGTLCFVVEGPRGAGSRVCGGVNPSPRPSVMIIGGQAVAGDLRVTALVPDAITSVVVNGHVVAPVENVMHIDLPHGTRTVEVEYRTDEGVVHAWDEKHSTDRDTPSSRLEAFGAQARALQTRPPYLGVALCDRANSIACDRVGLSVWLRKPARSVAAKIWGRPIQLDDEIWSGPLKDGLRRRFAGFLHPAGLLEGLHRIALPAGVTRWTGVPPATAPVIITVTYRDGRIATAAMRVTLHPGWG